MLLLFVISMTMLCIQIQQTSKWWKQIKHNTTAKQKVSGQFLTQKQHKKQLNTQKNYNKLEKQHTYTDLILL